MSEVIEDLMEFVESCKKQPDMKKVYLIKSIEEYGKLLAFCIERDILVFRTYWDEREKGNRCYSVDFKNKQCYYSSKEYYLNNNDKIITPVFKFDKYGQVYIEKED